MSEFGDRMMAQRKVLALVNRSCRNGEELYGLSSKAIDRWVGANDAGQSAPLVSLIRQTSDQLCFLANKSQDQVTDSYRHLASRVTHLTELVRLELTTG